VRAAVALLLAAALAGCGGGSAHGSPTPSKTETPDRVASRGTETAAAPRMTLRQVIGQHTVFAYSGTTPPGALKRRIARGEAAGVILSSRNVRSIKSLHRQMAALQAINNRRDPDAEFHPLLVMVAQEGGQVRQLPGPPSRGAADTPSVNAAHDTGAAASKLLKKAGVNVDLAPVVDVARPGSLLETEGRTYSRDPAVVAKRAAWFAGALRAYDLLPVYAHFPGLGAATTEDPTRINLPLSTLRAIDMRVYDELYRDAVMVSSAIYPRVDPRPAVFSRRWITGELRHRLHYRDTVVLSDDLEALASYGSPARLAVLALRAGVDMPVFAHDYATGARAAAGLERAVRSGKLKRADVEAGAKRVLEWRESRLIGGGP
jgi:beta-N-acetylhexosaminidase